MEGEEEIHPAMQLLLARMDSHPEEFEDDIRWGHKYQMFKSHWNPTEKVAPDLDGDHGRLVDGQDPGHGELPLESARVLHLMVLVGGQDLERH